MPTREQRNRGRRAGATVSPAEDAAINAGIAEDPDNPEWTDEMFAAARPAAEIVPDVVAVYRRGRGPQRHPVKRQITLRLDPDVIEHFRTSGPGWMARINAALRRAAGLKGR